jgi:hypothetical protein
LRIHDRLCAAVLALSFAAAGTPSAAALARQALHPPAQFKLTQDGGGLGVYVKETVTFSFVRPGRFWSVERRRTDSNWCGRKDGDRCSETRTSVHDWVTGRDCPVLARIMKELPQAQEADRVINRRQGREHKVIAVNDTPLLTLEARATGTGKAASQSEWVGPLVDWWESAEQRLKPCWKETRRLTHR